MCGCCCDFRRGVIIINTIVAISEALVIVLCATGAWTVYFDTSTQELEEYMKPYIIGEIAMSIVSIMLTSLAIFGAIRFSIKMVLPNFIWLLLGFVISLVMIIYSCAKWEDKDYGYYDYTCTINFPAILISAGWVAFWCYPHIGFIQEVRKGIMTEETYPREKYSCCCV